MLRAGGSSFGKSGGNNDVKDRVFFSLLFQILRQMRHLSNVYIPFC